METLSGFAARCYFRSDGVFCQEGRLRFLREPYAMYMVEGEEVECPACQGKGLVLTSTGKDLLEFLKIFGKGLSQ